LGKKQRTAGGTVWCLLPPTEAMAWGALDSSLVRAGVQLINLQRGSQYRDRQQIVAVLCSGKLSHRLDDRAMFHSFMPETF
jgi:lactate dehydrogenase-like 2-hydroxyacid dehydrogenase